MFEEKSSVLFDDDKYMRLFNTAANGLGCMLEQKKDILSLLKKHRLDQLKSYKVVELGCGYCDKLEFFRSNLFQDDRLDWFHGYDYSQVCVDRNKAYYEKDPRISFEYKDITQLDAFSELQANFVYDWWGASYSGVEQSIKVAKKLLAPGGYYLLVNWRGDINVNDAMRRQTFIEMKQIRSWKAFMGLYAATKMRIKGYNSFVEGITLPAPEDIPNMLESNDLLVIHVGTFFCFESMLLILAQKK